MGSNILLPERRGAAQTVAKTDDRLFPLGQTGVNGVVELPRVLLA